MGKEGEKRPYHKILHTNTRLQELLHGDLTLGQRCADIIARHVGSWHFIIFFIVFMIFWICLNITAIIGRWDPYPFILLNFVLSTIAAMQGPIILMAQNRSTERDRRNFKYDYHVNRKAELEIQRVLRELETIKKHLYKQEHERKK
ncbi:DUF1003 domain-containing protein [Candidatus Woesearchaeota archaeon]|nr:DUF1003 domain-containing protein [Candidatus Woesearchaeota archaeon]